MASTHFTLAEAVEHLPGLLERAAAGDETLVERPGRTALTSAAQEKSQERVLNQVMAQVIAQVIAPGKPRDESKWD